MDINVLKGNIEKFDCDILVVNIFEGVKKPAGVLAVVDKALGGIITELISSKEIDGKAGNSTIIHTQGKIPAKRVLIVGLGKKEDFKLDNIRTVGALIIRNAKSVKAKKVGTILHGAGAARIDVEDATYALLEGMKLSDYKYKGYKEEKKEDKEIPVSEVAILDNKAGVVRQIRDAANASDIITDCINGARDLVNTPSNHLTPTLFVRAAERVAKEPGLTLKVLSSAEIRKEKMGALLSVARGSNEEPKVVVITYRGKVQKTKRGKNKANEEVIGLIGKGITFDSGGISLKPSRKMAEMKTDMSGAAAVLMTMKAAARLKLAQKVIAVMPLTENMPSGKATKPGDVVIASSGKSIEIINTDAEGRLILADGISYAKKLGATKLIDVATLTGACVVALGDAASGIMGNNQGFIRQIKDAGDKSGEKMWQLPLYDEYKEYIKSDVADIKNSSEMGKAGASSGGIFLQNFSGDTPWVHMDIAGTAYKDAGNGYIGAGATGVGVRTLVRYLSSL